MPPSSERRSRGNPNVEPLAQEHVIAAQVPGHTRFFFHDPNLARLPDGRLVIAAPQWGRSRTPDAGTRHLRVLGSDDGGTTWDEAPALPYQEGRPFVLDGRLLMFVQEESHRDFLLVGSDDGGRSWSDPVRVLRGPLWNISTAMLERDGELLWAMDYDLPDALYAGKVMVRFDRRRSPFDPGGWSMSEVLEAPEMPEALIGSALRGEQAAGAVPGARTRPFAWLEPNTVEVAGHVRVFVRCTIRSQGMAHVAAALEYDAAAGRLRFDQFVPWPGGQCKFFIIHDRPAGMYWMLGNLVTNSRDYLGWGERVEQARYRRAAGERRWLFLHYSIDCLSWFPGRLRGPLAGRRAPQLHVPERRGRRRRPGAAVPHQPRLARPARCGSVHDSPGARLPQPGDGPARRWPASDRPRRRTAGVDSEALTVWRRTCTPVR